MLLPKTDQTNSKRTIQKRRLSLQRLFTSKVGLDRFANAVPGFFHEHREVRQGMNEAAPRLVQRGKRPVVAFDRLVLMRSVKTNAIGHIQEWSWWTIRPRNLSGLIGDAASQLSKHLQDAIQMSQPRTITVNELVQHEIAIC